MCIWGYEIFGIQRIDLYIWYTVNLGCNQPEEVNLVKFVPDV